MALANESGFVPLATITRTLAPASEEDISAEREHALAREAAERMAKALVRFAATRRRRAPDVRDVVIVDHITTHRASYRLRGEMLAPASKVPVVLVAIEREPDTYPAYQKLRATYGLTRTEARVATMLAERMSNDEVARELGVTGATARRHTERILLKLGVARRSAVRRVLVGNRAGDGVSGRARSAYPDETLASDGGPRRGRPKKEIQRRHECKESVVVLLEREYERRVVHDALAGEVNLRFAEGPGEVHPPWRYETPIAVIVGLQAEGERRLERALGILRREAPDIPICGWLDLGPASVQAAIRLAARGLISTAITSGEDPGRRLRAILKDARARSEREALWSIWGERVRPETKLIVEACIAASATAATIRDVQLQLDKSPRTLSRELSNHGLPSLARVLALSRLLRATYRLDNRGIQVKTVASQLGYNEPSGLSHQFQWFTGLSISSLPVGRRFTTLASLVRAEIAATRSQMHATRGRGVTRRKRRQPGRA